MGPRTALGLLLLAVYGSFYASLGHNETAHLDLTRAIAEHGTLAVDRYRYNSADLVVHEGRTYSNKAPGTALLALPAYVAARTLTQALPLSETARWDLVAYLTILGSVALLSILGAVKSFQLACRVTGDRRAALGSVLCLWLATPLLAFSTLLFGHALAAALVALGAARLLDRDAPTSLGRDLLAGLCLGLAVTTEYPALLVALPLVAVSVPSRGRRAAGVLLGCAIGLGPLLIYQQMAFGDALFPAYQAYVAEGSRANFPAHARGFLGVHWPGGFGFFDALAEITIRPARGLLRLCPVLWLALPGLLLLQRSGRRREAVAIAVAGLALVTMNACYGDSIVFWGGGTSLGPRHLIPMLPLLTLPVAHATQRFPRSLLALGLVSALAMLLGTAIEPRLPYEHAQPLRDFLIPRYLRGEFALHQAVLFTPGVPGTARHLGGVLGLPGPWQLVPLACVSILAGATLMRSVAMPSGVGRTVWLFVVGLAIVPVAWSAAQPAGSLRGAWFVDEPGALPRWRTERELDFDWRRDAPVLPPFRAEWTGALRVVDAGPYRFRLEGDGEHALVLDGREIHAATSPRGATLALSVGDHAIALRTRPAPNAGGLRLLWQPPGGSEAIVPATAFAARP